MQRIGIAALGSFTARLRLLTHTRSRALQSRPHTLPPILFLPLILGAAAAAYPTQAAAGFASAARSRQLLELELAASRIIASALPSDSHSLSLSFEMSWRS